MNRQGLGGYHFSADWGGSRIGFIEITGIERRFEVVSSREGHSPDGGFAEAPGIEARLPVIFRRLVVAGDLDFVNWIDTCRGSQAERRDISIHLLDKTHAPVMTWVIKSAFPVRYIGPTFRAQSSEPAIEALEVMHEGILVR